MREQSWYRRLLHDHVARQGAPGRHRRMHWLVISGAVALGMAAMVATSVIGPQSALAAPAQPLATCIPDPATKPLKPTVSIVNSDTSQFVGGQAITIQGYGYVDNAPLTLVVTATGIQTSSTTGTTHAGTFTDAIPVTADITGCFSTTYTLPPPNKELVAGQFVTVGNPYPITVQVYNEYATPLANLALRSCSEGPSLEASGGTACGPQTLLQDSTGYQSVYPLEQHAEQEIAGLRGVANDTTNDYFSRGEIRAQMFVNLLAKINACGASNSTGPNCSASDQAIVAYYSGRVLSEREDVATLADNLFEASSTFCIPFTQSCGWTSWKSNPCFFLVPLGSSAITDGPSQTDSAQQAYENTVCNGPPNNPFSAYVSPTQPSYSDFTSWAAAAIFGSQLVQWAQSLMSVDNSYATLKDALNQVQTEYLAAMDTFQEGDQYLTLKHTQIPTLSSTTAADQDLQGSWLEGFGEFAQDQMTDLVKSLASSLTEVLIEELATEMPELAGTSETLAPLLIAAFAATAIGLYVTITDAQLGCSLQSARSAAQSDNLYNDINGKTSYTFSGSLCPSGSVTISPGGGDALVLSALMASTMPDFMNLRGQASHAGVGPAQPSDPVFVTSHTPYVATNAISVKTWSGLPAEVSVVNGWLSVSGQYQPDVEYQLGGKFYRSWIDGNQFDTYLVAYPLGDVAVQSLLATGCPGFLPPGGFVSSTDGECLVPSPSTVSNFQSTPISNMQSGVVYDVAIGQMTGEEGAQTEDGGSSSTLFSFYPSAGMPTPGIENALISKASGFSTQCAVLCVSQGIPLQTPAKDTPATPTYDTPAYLLTDPEPGCFTSSPFGGSATPECSVGSLLYADVSTNQEDFAALHYVGAADDTFTADSNGQVTGGVLNNDGLTFADQYVLTHQDTLNGYTQVSVVDGVSNGQLNLTASTPGFVSNGDFVYTANTAFAPNSGGPICKQFPIGTISQGYNVCGGPTASAADSFIYTLCYTVADVVDGGSAPTACSYARASVTVQQVLSFSPPGPKTYGDPTFANPATSNGPGPITYTTGSGSVGCSIDATGTVTITGAAVGSNFCILTVSQGGTGGFLTAVPVTIKFHIAQAPLSVTASHGALTYGDAAPAASSYTVSYSGFKLSDTQASIVGSTAPSCATNYTPGSDQGFYPINCTIGTLSATNYTFVSGYTGSHGFPSTNGTALSSTIVQLGAIQVNPAPLSVTASHTALTYGDAAPGSYTFSYSGFKLSDTQASVVGNNAPSCATTYQQGNNAGSYAISCTRGSLDPFDYTVVSGYTGSDGFASTNGTPLSSSAVQIGAFNVNPAPLYVTAAHTDLTFGDPIPAASSYTVSYSGFKLSDTQTSIVGGNAPDCATDYTVAPVGGGAGNYGIVCALGTLSATNYTFVSGYTGSHGFGSTSGTPLVPDPPGSPVLLGAFKVNPAVLTVTPPTPSSSVQYSDPLPDLTPTVTGFVLNFTSATAFTTQPTCTPGPVTASFANAAGTVTTTTGVNAPATTYTITCSGAVLYGYLANDFTVVYNTSTLTVTQEDAAVDLTGSQSAVALSTTGGAATNLLTATVWDSAATGYTGANPESGATGTIGDVTKMFVEFDIYPAGSCLSGSPAFAPVVPVSVTTTAGVGTASYSFTQSTPGAFCVVPRVVGATAGSTNGYYTAPDGPVNGLAFYVPNGAFVTGGGWVPDAGSSNGHGNFGFEAHYNNSKPKGQFVYVWRGTYNGQAANFIIKSNAITALTIVQLGPNSYQATLQGKCSYSIVSQATGQQLYGEGNDTFMVTVTDGDNGLPQPQAANDNFTLITFQSGNVQLHPIATIPLSKGDVVVHN